MTTKLLVPSDQIGCVIKKGDKIVQNIRSDTGAQIGRLKDKHLSWYTLSSDELVLVTRDREAYMASVLARYKNLWLKGRSII